MLIFIISLTTWTIPTKWNILQILFLNLIYEESLFKFLVLQIAIAYILFIADSPGRYYDNAIQESCGLMFNFIKTSPSAWAPIISEVFIK